MIQATQEKHHHLGEHVHRIGYHFRSYIVDQATIVLGGESATRDGGGLATSDADAIPDSQEEINKQADAALRDLYPRIPNTDREMIIQHAFQKVDSEYSFMNTTLILFRVPFLMAKLWLASKQT